MSILDELASELGISPDSLRSSILAGDETLSPTYITVNPDGTVTATFPGGIILPEGIQGEVIRTGSPGAAVQWTDPTTGALVAQESVVHKGLPLPSQPSDIYSILLQPGIEQNVGPIAGLSFEVLAAVAGVAKGQILLDTWDNNNAGFTKTLLRSDGYSNFLQLVGFVEHLGGLSTANISYVDLGAGSLTISNPGNYLVMVEAQIEGLGAVSPNGAGFAASDDHAAVEATNATGAVINETAHSAFVIALTGTNQSLTPYFRSISGASVQFVRTRMLVFGPT